MRNRTVLLPSFVLSALVAASSASGSPTPTSTETPPRLRFELSAPGYLLIDDRWYVYDEAADGSSGSRRIGLHTLGGGAMFLHGWISGRNCTSAGLGGTPPPGRLAAGEVFGVEEVVVPIQNTGLEPTRAHFFLCEGVLTIALQSPRGDVRCNGPIPPPVTPQQCPVLRNLPAVGGIFRSGFEP